MTQDRTRPGGDAELAVVIEFPGWRRHADAASEGLPETPDDGLGGDGIEDDDWSYAVAGAGPAAGLEGQAQGTACMAELVAMLAADGEDVVAFARAVPARFRRRLPAGLRLAAGLGR